MTFRNKIDALKERAKLLGEGFYNGNLKEDVQIIDAIFDLYREIFKITWAKTRCASCYLDCYMILANIKDSQLMEIENLLYDLKPGKLLKGFPMGDSSKNCSRHNLTNELAEWHLKNNPGIEIYFSKLPPDWKERIGRMPEEKKEKANDQVNDDVNKTVVVKVKGKSRAKLLSEAIKLQNKGLINKEIKLNGLDAKALTDLINKK